MESTLGVDANTRQEYVTIHIGYGELEVTFTAIDVRHARESEYKEYKKGFTFIPKNSHFMPFQPRLGISLIPVGPPPRPIEDAVIVCKTENHVFIVRANDSAVVRIHGTETFRRDNADIVCWVFIHTMV